MSEMAKKARAAMKEKAQGRAAPTKGSVDASGWTEPTMNTTAKLGMRPLSRRQFKKGGRVEGEMATQHAGKRPRKAAGGSSDFTAMANANKDAAREAAVRKIIAEGEAPVPMPRRDRIMDRLPTDRPFAPEKRGGRTMRKDGGKALSANSLINRDAKEANEERGYPHTGGYKRGGMAMGGYKKGGEVHEDAAMDKKLIKAEMAKHEKGCRCAKCWGGRTGKADGGANGGRLKKYMVLVHNGYNYEPQRTIAGTSRADAYDRWQKIGSPSETRKFKIGQIQPEEKAKGGSVADEAGTRPTGGRIARDKGGKTERSPELQELYDQRANTNGHKARARIQDQIDKMEGKYKAPSMLDAMDPYERTARKSGGRAKGKTNIRINIIAGKPTDAGAPPPPMGGLPGPMPRPPMPVAPLPAGGAGMPPMGPPPAPMGGGLPPGLGVAPPAMGPMARKAGGRVYRSYKDMDAGAGGGLGRLEKTEIQKNKK